MPQPVFAPTDAASHPGYLGNIKVVDTLVRQFLMDMLEETDSAGAARVVTRYAGIFAGATPEHPPIDGWNNSSRGLGADLRRYLSVDDNQNIVDMLRSALYMLALKCRQIIRAAHGDKSETAARTKPVIEQFVNVLLGTGFALSES